MNAWTLARRVLANPAFAWRAGLSVARAWYYRAKFKLLRRRVVIGRGFRVIGRLDIRGPGTVIFGDNCRITSGLMQVTTPWTHAPEAVLRFGDNVTLTGTRFGCALSIEVGDNAGLSDARIMDSDFHAIQNAEARRNTAGRSKPVRIGRNAWLAAGCMVLKGVSIGDNAVVGAGAVVMSNVPDNAVVVGNPARVIWRVQPPTPAPEAPSKHPPANDAEQAVGA